MIQSCNDTIMQLELIVKWEYLAFGNFHRMIVSLNNRMIAIWGLTAFGNFHLMIA